LGLPTVEASMAGNFRLNIGGRGFPAADSLVSCQLLRRPVLNRIICNFSEQQETCSERNSRGLEITVRSFAERAKPRGPATFHEWQYLFSYFAHGG
jgi:hypothetical protein